MAVENKVKTNIVLAEKTYKNKMYLKGGRKMKIGGKDYIMYFSIALDDNGQPIPYDAKDGTPIVYMNMNLVRVNGTYNSI